MNGKPLKEADEIIYAVCFLYRDYAKARSVEGIKVGMNLTKELSIYKIQKQGSFYRATLPV